MGSPTNRSRCQSILATQGLGNVQVNRRQHTVFECFRYLSSSRTYLLARNISTPMLPHHALFSLLLIAPILSALPIKR